MTIWELLNIAGNLILNTDTSAEGLWGLFVTDRKLNAKPLRDRTSSDTYVCHYDPHDVTDAIPADEWNQLKARLSFLRKECVL